MALSSECLVLSIDSFVAFCGSCKRTPWRLRQERFKKKSGLFSGKISFQKRIAKLKSELNLGLPNFSSSKELKGCLFIYHPTFISYLCLNYFCSIHLKLEPQMSSRGYAFITFGWNSTLSFRKSKFDLEMSLGGLAFLNI